MIFRIYPEDLHIIQLDNVISYFYSQAESPENIIFYPLTAQSLIP